MHAGTFRLLVPSHAGDSGTTSGPWSPVEDTDGNA